MKHPRSLEIASRPLQYGDLRGRPIPQSLLGLFWIPPYDVSRSDVPFWHPMNHIQQVHRVVNISGVVGSLRYAVFQMKSVVALTKYVFELQIYECTRRLRSLDKHSRGDEEV